MWKTTIVIWTDCDPSNLELEHLAREAQVGDAYCSKQHIQKIEDVNSDPDWDGTDFFGSIEES